MFGSKGWGTMNDGRSSWIDRKGTGSQTQCSFLLRLEVRRPLVCGLFYAPKKGRFMDGRPLNKNKDWFKPVRSNILLNGDPKNTINTSILSINCVTLNYCTTSNYCESYIRHQQKRRVHQNDNVHPHGRVPGQKGKQDFAH